MTVARPLAWMILAVAAAAPWAFGALDPSWSALLAGLCLVAGAAAWGAGAFAASPATHGPPRRTLIAMGAVAAAAAIGLLPLPEFLRSLVAPSATELLAQSGAGTGWRPSSLVPRGTADALALAIAYVAAFALLAAEARRPGGRRVISATLTLSGAGLALLGLVQHATQAGDQNPAIYWTYPVYEAGTPFGPYPNRNHFAGVMALLSAIAAGECLAAWVDTRRAVALAYGAAVLLMLTALGTTSSRGGALGALAGGAFLVACAPAGRRLRSLLPALAAGTAVVLVLAWTGALASLVERIPQVGGRALNRFGVQRDALAAFLENPVLGTGAGTFDRVYPAYQRVCDDRTFHDAHSDWVQILMETGVLGFAVAVLVVRELAAWVRAGIAADRARRWRVLGPAAGAVAIAVHGFVDINLHVPANALLTVCALSLASAAAAGPAAHDASGDTPEPCAAGPGPAAEPDPRATRGPDSEERGTGAGPAPGP